MEHHIVCLHPLFFPVWWVLETSVHRVDHVELPIRGFTIKTACVTSEFFVLASMGALGRMEMEGLRLRSGF